MISEAGVLILSYLVGSLPTGYIVTKILTGADPREEGSKNVGGLNTFRIVSRKKNKLTGVLSGSLVAVVDATKAVIAYFIATFYAPSVAFLAPMFAVLGHNYPVWLNFRGGRGVAAFYGFLLFLNPILLVPYLLIQGTVYHLTRRFSPGMILSLLTAFPLLHIAGVNVPLSAILTEFPVWLRYKEKHDLMVKGELGVGM